MKNLKKSVMMVLAIAVMVSCFSFPAMAVTSTPEVVVTSTQSSQPVVRALTHEISFLGETGYTEAVYTNKAEVFTTNYTWYKKCALGGNSYYNTSKYSATVEYPDWAMRTAAGWCYTDVYMTDMEYATLRIWI